MGIMKEFREFAVKGNVMDMAVGIIIGGAFGTIAKSLVADVLMPPIGMLLGGVDFNQFKAEIQPAELGADGAVITEAVTINYGVFINNIISFLVVALAVFFMVKVMNRMKREEEAPPAEPTHKDCPECLSSIPIKASRCAHCTASLAAEA